MTERTRPTGTTEHREAGQPSLQGDGWTLNTLVIPFNTPANIQDHGPGGYFVERYAPTCCDKKGTFDKAVAYLGHNSSGLAYGSVRAGTMSMEKRSDGWHAIIPLDKRSPDHQSLKIAIDRQDIGGSSAGFIVDRDRWSFTPDGHEDRTIDSMTVFDVSLTASPAYESTSTSMRSRQGAVAWRELLDRLSRGKTPGPKKNCPACAGRCVDQQNKVCGFCKGKGTVPMNMNLVHTYVGGPSGDEGGTGSGNPLGGLADATGTRAAAIARETAHQELVMGLTHGRAPTRAQIQRLMDFDAEIARSERIRKARRLRDEFELKLAMAGRR
jgi:Escherichia/Staphylococcus phage prohead protease